MNAEQRIVVISAFGALLEKGKSLVGRELDLPFPKELIRQALSEELTNPTLPIPMDALETGFLELESFVIEEDFQIIQQFEKAMAEAPQLGPEASQEAVLRSARRLSEVSDPAIAILNRITALQESRMNQIKQIRLLRSKL